MSDWSSDVCSSDLTDAAPLTPADAEEADRRATMAQPVGVVLHTAASHFSHYHSFNHSSSPPVGAPHAGLEAALTSAEIGTAPCRERRCQSVKRSCVAGASTKTNPYIIDHVR